MKKSKTPKYAHAKKVFVSCKKRHSELLDGALRYALPIFLMTAAAAFIVYGVFNGEISAVFHKAIILCRECVGIG